MLLVGVTVLLAVCVKEAVFEGVRVLLAVFEDVTVGDFVPLRDPVMVPVEEIVFEGVVLDVIVWLAVCVCVSVWVGVLVRVPVLEDVCVGVLVRVPVLEAVCVDEIVGE